VLEEATTSRPDLSAHYSSLLGSSYEKLQQYEEAMAAYRAATLAAPENCSSWLKLAAVCGKVGSLEGSIHALENGIQNVSLTDTNRFNLIKQFWKVCNSNAYNERAIAQLEKERNKTPGQPALWRLLGEAHTAVGNQEQAMTCFQTAIEKGCGKYSRLLLANIHRINGNLNEAIRVYKAAAAYCHVTRRLAYRFRRSHVATHSYLIVVRTASHTIHTTKVWKDW
jgi:tetratricopeptide (TPR) repeat protein